MIIVHDVLIITHNATSIRGHYASECFWTIYHCSKLRDVGQWSFRETILKILWPNTSYHDGRFVSIRCDCLIVILIALGRMGWYWSFVLMPYGELWRRNRRAFHQHFMPTVISRYHPVQLREARRLVARLAKTPEDFLHHIRQCVN